MYIQSFNNAYQQLNTAQRAAVNYIDGPLLVIAGPGTGKTQLLSTRVANILKQTDINPRNILCVTFTDNASRNMRERLETIIGQAAYRVSIHTFHSFGSEVISNYQDYFADRALLQQTDELGTFQIMHQIFEKLPHSNPLSIKVGDTYIALKDTLSVISWLKQNGLAPSELIQLLSANKEHISHAAPDLADVFSSTPSPKLLPQYQAFATMLLKQSGQRLFGFGDFAQQCAHELMAAIELTSKTSRFAPSITAWRNKWCTKGNDGKHVFKEAGKNLVKMFAVADVYDQLLKEMKKQGLYDFDDMIIETVHALEAHDDLRFTLQERYQYILVDEFQDTNKAQFRILEALGNNPVHEGRPNIMVVGDDDQAIYSFQGADSSNMASFFERFKPEVVQLVDSYRSAAEILEVGYEVAANITDRLVLDTHKRNTQLTAQATYDNSVLSHQVFSSELAQYEWISQQIASQIKQGTSPRAIAVIAPKHKYLERLMPYLGQKHIPISYERRENILDAPIVLQLDTMINLLVALAENQHDRVDSLLSTVLSYSFWGIDASKLMKTSLEAYDSHTHWLQVIAASADSKIKLITEWLIEIARTISYEPIEYVLDTLLGTRKMDNSSFTSPMRQFHFGDPLEETNTDNYLALLGQLSTLRHRLRSWKPATTILASDWEELVRLHRTANLKIIDTNPHSQTTNAVQVMTAYKAKGLEFDCVFLINAQDEIWGPTARSKNSIISLPKNLPIAPLADSDNDKLRLFFVALTRAKHTLFITSYTTNLENKPSPGLSFVGGNNLESEPVHAALKPQYVDTPTSAESIDILHTDWQYRFQQVIADTPTLFEPIIKNYKLSVTHLNNFIDIVGAGPQYFLTHNLLRFPEAPTPPAAYGDAIHKTLQWIHTELRTTKLPGIKSVQTFFSDILSRKHLRPEDLRRLDERGRQALKFYLEQRGRNLDPADLVERGFNNDGSMLGQAHLSGKLDKMHFISAEKISVVDFKTGKPAVNWQGKDEYERVKLYKYRQQLLFYKLLVEHSATYSHKAKVTIGALEFVEANSEGRLIDNLVLEFDSQELDEFSQLIQAVWQHIVTLNFPSTDSYPKSLAGVKQFEQDLKSGVI